MGNDNYVAHHTLYCVVYTVPDMSSSRVLPCYAASSDSATNDLGACNTGLKSKSLKVNRCLNKSMLSAHMLDGADMENYVRMFKYASQSSEARLCFLPQLAMMLQIS